MSIFSAPCGYFTSSPSTRTSRSAGTVRRSASIASGLLFSTPTIARETPRACIMTRRPKWTRSGCSTMVRWSPVR